MLATRARGQARPRLKDYEWKRGGAVKGSRPLARRLKTRGLCGRAGGSGGRRRVEAHALIDFAHGEGAAERAELRRRVEIVRLGVNSVPVVLLEEARDVRAVLRDEQVLAQRRDGVVVSKLVAAVVGFGRRRKHFDN